MDKIDDRLRDASARCVKAYEAWKDNQKDVSAREELRESIHELRKVSSRLEIDMAVSEREEMSQKPIPIPSHRSSRGKGKDGGRGKSKQDDDNVGNSNSGNGGSDGPEVEKVKSRGGGKRGGGKKQASE